MNTIKKFDEYCNALSKSGEIFEKVMLVSFCRAWIIEVQNLDLGQSEDKLGYVGLSEIGNIENFPICDEISRIATDTLEAVSHIAANFREKILRENVLMPIHRAKEISSAGLNWLSKRSGRNIQEKLSSTNRLLGVQRRLSLDTGENRLFVAFLKEMEIFIEQKNSAKPELITNAEKNFQELALKILHNEEVEEIGRWENLPPNNTLLSDRFYRQIWRGWIDLQSLSEMLDSDEKNLSKIICTVFYFLLIGKIFYREKFSQRPVIYDYKNFKLSLISGEEIFIEGKQIKIIKNAEKIQVLYKGTTFFANFLETEVLFFSGDVCVGKEKITAKNFSVAVKTFWELIYGKEFPEVEEKNFVSKKISACRKTFADIFSARPIYIDKNGETKIFPARIVRQEFFAGDKIFDLSAEKSVSLKLVEDNSAKIYSINSCMAEKIPEQEKIINLFQIIHKNFSSSTERVESLSIPLPDVYNEFQLSAIRRGARIFYKQVQTIPQSLSILFSEMKLGRCKKFKNGDFALVVDFLNGKISFTLVRATYSSRIANILPETRGLIWKRHPTFSQVYKISDSETFEDLLCEKILKNTSITSKKTVAKIFKVFKTEDLLDEIDDLDFEIEEQKNSNRLTLSEENILNLLDTKFSVTKFLQSYLERMSEIIGQNNVHIYSLSSALNFDDLEVTFKTEKFSALEGMKFYYELQKKVNSAEKNIKDKLPPLWTDQLPYLAIKRLYGAFDLIEKKSAKKILPQFGVPQNIPVAQHFTLPKGKNSYHFGLLLSESQEISYEAVIKHRAFPLSKDTECILNLTYTYGKDIPYELIFKPVNSQAFLEAKVEWQPVSEQSYDNLPAPTFPKNNFTWKDFQNFKTKKFQNSDLLEWIERSLHRTAYMDFDKVKFWIKKLPIKEIDPIMYVKIHSAGKRFLLQMSSKNGDLKYFNGKPEGFFSCAIGQKVDRYKIEISGNEWKMDRNGNKYFVKYVDFEFPEVIFYESEFLFDAKIKFSNRYKVTFEIITNQTTGRSKATNIIVGGEDYISYRIQNVIKGKVPYDFSNFSVMFPLHTVYTQGRNTKKGDCPVSFKKFVRDFMNFAPKFFEEAWNEKNFYYASKILRVLCVMSTEADDSLFKIIFMVLEERPKILHEDVGCVLGDYDTDSQVELLDKIFVSEIKVENVIKILNRASWKSEKFIFNLPAQFIFRHLKKAVDIVVSRDKFTPKIVLSCLEFIFATFRLRKKGDEEMNKFLSPRNELFSKLYITLEEMISGGYELPQSKIELEIKKSSEYNISNFYYALLVCINGGEDEIKISGINEELVDSE